MRILRKKRVALLLVCAMVAPVPAVVSASDEMFSAMFRMMLVMMNAMSDAMLENNNDAGWGAGDPFGTGMTGWPMMSGIYGMNPATGFGSIPGMSPWSGMNPATGFGGLPGMSQWGSPSNSNPWANPFMNIYPYNAINPYGNQGYGDYQQRQVSLLEGKWYGNSGEILEIRGNRFRLQDGRSTIKGVITIENNIVSLYSPQAGAVTQYTFVRNQSELMLQDATGQVLTFSKKPMGRGMYLF
jgi:hypothetical protein